MNLQPDLSKITISDNERLVQKYLNEMFIIPRLDSLKWAGITKQSPHLKVGYSGQILASLILGMEGMRTAARGNDIVDGTEVKSCIRIDALDTCQNCSEKCFRIDASCPHCGSKDIDRDNTSKWLFSVKNDLEFRQLTEETPRIALILIDYPYFDRQDYNSIQIQVFEIWVQDSLCSRFKEIMRIYYDEIFKHHIAKNPNKTPAPKNFWPYSYQFYLSNPRKIFHAHITDADQNPSLRIDRFYPLTANRYNLQPESMPTTLLKDEWDVLVKNDAFTAEYPATTPYSLQAKISPKDRISLSEEVPFINANTRMILPLRESKPFVLKTQHQRKKKS